MVMNLTLVLTGLRLTRATCSKLSSLTLIPLGAILARGDAESSAAAPETAATEKSNEKTTLKIYIHTYYCDTVADKPGIECIDARTIRWMTSDPLAILS